MAQQGTLIKCNNMLPTNNGVYEKYFMIWKHAYGKKLSEKRIMKNYNCI